MTTEPTQQNLSSPEKLLDLPEGFEIWRLQPLQLQEQNKNARVQSGKVFKSLVRNVKKRGALESLPFCAREGEKFWIISGHHRVRASIQAELKTILVLVDPAPKTRASLVAKQIAHNAINGQDDPAMLQQLLEEIDDVDALLESAIDRETIEKLANPVNASDVSVDYDWKLITFAFLPKHIADLEEMCKVLGSSELVFTAEKAAHEQLVVALKKLGRQDDIRSMGAIVYRMIEIVNEYLATKTESEAPAGPVQPDAAA